MESRISLLASDRVNDFERKQCRKCVLIGSISHRTEKFHFFNIVLLMQKYILMRELAISWLIKMIQPYFSVFINRAHEYRNLVRVQRHHAYSSGRSGGMFCARNLDVTQPSPGLFGTSFSRLFATQRSSGWSPLIFSNNTESK